MIAVTGAGGFIGRNILNNLPENKDIIVVDYKKNMQDLFYDKYIKKTPHEFIKEFENGFYKKLEVVFHQGACSNTMIYDAAYMMNKNFDYSHRLFHACMNKEVSFLYASSASVYGDGPFTEGVALKSKNVYALSKKLFDEYVESFINEDLPCQVVGLRYYNVYGPHESRKKKMASVLHQFHEQAKNYSKVKIFENSKKYFRDFIFVDDVVKINLHFYRNKQISGIFNCGTGKSRSFSDIVDIMAKYERFEVEEIALPKVLEGKYQKFTESDNRKLQLVGKYDSDFLSLEEGIEKYYKYWSVENE